MRDIGLFMECINVYVHVGLFQISQNKSVLFWHSCLQNAHVHVHVGPTN